MTAQGMTLKEALQIGTTAYGRIKATFAELYDAAGNKLFSLQNRDAKFSAEELMRQVVKDSGVLAAQNTIVGLKIDKSTTLLLDGTITKRKADGIGATDDDLTYDFTTWDLPVVSTSTSEINAKKLVPVALVYEARNIILEKIAEKTDCYEVWVQYDYFENGVWGTKPKHKDWFLYDERYTMPIDSDYFQGASQFRFNPSKVSKWDKKYLKEQERSGVKLAEQEWYKYYVGRVLAQFTKAAKNMSYYKDQGKLAAVRKKGEMPMYNIVAGYDTNKTWRKRYYDKINGNPDVPIVITNIEIDIRKVEKPAPQYRKLVEILENNGTFYVKPIAFDWNAINTKNATIAENTELPSGQVLEAGTNIQEALEKAYKRMESAKNVLAVVGASNLL